MLTPEIMGVLALAIMWTATLLISAAAAGDLLRLVRRRAQVRPLSAPLEAGQIGALTGTIASPGTLAALTIEELGRARTGRRAILFHPRKTSGAIEGGVVRLDDGALVHVPPLGPEAAEVWRRAAAPDRAPRAAPDRAPRATPDLAFDAALEQARKARGFARTIAHAFVEGDRVTIAGRLAPRPDGAWALEPASDPSRLGEAPTVLVSATDPAAWYTRKIVLSVVGILGFLGSAALVTTLALIGPPFGTLTTVAGVLGLGQFLGAQPLGVALRDAVAAPDRAVVHHDWADPAGASPQVTSA